MTAQQVGFEERLRTPWWWYPAALFVGAILAAQFFLADRGVKVWLPYAVVLPITVAIVWWIGREQVLVESGEIRVRDAHLPLAAVAGMIELDPATLRRVVGREGDPSAFIAIRPWVGPGVQILLDDPDDPTPYWVVSTRHPRQMMAAIDAGHPRRTEGSRDDGGVGPSEGSTQGGTQGGTEGNTGGDTGGSAAG